MFETKVNSIAPLRHRISATAEHIRNHPDNIAGATQSLLMRAENCTAMGDTLNNYCNAGTVF